MTWCRLTFHPHIIIYIYIPLIRTGFLVSQFLLTADHNIMKEDIIIYDDGVKLPKFKPCGSFSAPIIQ